MEKPDRSIESAMKVFNKIIDILEKCPDLRVGQILDQIVDHPAFSQRKALFYIENQHLYEALEKFERNLK